MQLTKKLNQMRKWRHTGHLILFILFFTLPLPLPFEGFQNGTIKVDFETFRVHLFGLTLVPGLLHVISFTIIFVLFFIAVISTLYGKIFCGWMCPQNVFYELFEGIQTYLKKYFPFYRKRPRLQKGFDLLLSVVCALAVSLGFLHYFNEPSPIFTGVAFTFLFCFTTVDLHLLKHTFCRKACPYAFLQKSFTDKTSMHIAWDNREGNKCGICTACVKACYVDLDPKKTPFDIDCTNCGACIDACTHVYRFKEEPSLLTFGFEEKEKVPFSFFGINSYRKLALVFGFFFYIAAFAYIVFVLPSVKFSLTTGIKDPKTPFERSYSLLIRNLEKYPGTYSLSLSTPGFVFASEGGQEKRFELTPFEKINETFEVKAVREELPSFYPIDFELKKDGEVIQTQTIYF